MIRILLTYEQRKLLLKHGYLDPGIAEIFRAGSASRQDGFYFFTDSDLDMITGSLSYTCNRTRSTNLALELDELCSYLEFAVRTQGDQP